MTSLPQENGSRIWLTDLAFRPVLDAFNFHAETTTPAGALMVRIGPDDVVMNGAHRFRDEMAGELIKRAIEAVRPA